MVPMQKDDAIGFRAPAALKQALEAAAEAEHRSLGQLCTLVLMQYLEKRGEWPPRNQAARRNGPGTGGGRGASARAISRGERTRARRS